MRIRWPQLPSPISSSRGFTLIELLVVMGILGVVVMLSTINLASPQVRASVGGARDVLVADLKNQQLKSMAGDGGEASSAQAHGVYFQTDRYTIFKGDTYSAGDGENFVVMLGTGVSASTTFGSSQVVFAKGAGDVNSFVDGSNTVTLSGGGESRIITLNRYGAVTLN